MFSLRAASAPKRSFFSFLIFLDELISLGNLTCNAGIRTPLPRWRIIDELCFLVGTDDILASNRQCLNHFHKSRYLLEWLVLLHFFSRYYHMLMVAFYILRSELWNSDCCITEIGSICTNHELNYASCKGSVNLTWIPSGPQWCFICLACTFLILRKKVYQCERLTLSNMEPFTFMFWLLNEHLSPPSVENYTCVPPWYFISLWRG